MYLIFLGKCYIILRANSKPLLDITKLDFPVLIPNGIGPGVPMKVSSLKNSSINGFDYNFNIFIYK